MTKLPLVTTVAITTAAATAAAVTTVAAAKIFISLSGTPPTLNIFDQKIGASSSKNISSDSPCILSKTVISGTSTELSSSYDKNRQTTEAEKIIRELRDWQFLDEDWDGEGASKPLLTSINAAVQFINLIKPEVPFPEPMIHASGFTSLLWDRDDFYAEIQFISNNKIAYFVKNHEGKRFKGTTEFDTKQIPFAISDLIEV